MDETERRPMPAGVIIKWQGLPLEHIGGGIFAAAPETWRLLMEGPNDHRARVEIVLGPNFDFGRRSGRGTLWARVRWWLLTGQWVSRVA